MPSTNSNTLPVQPVPLLAPPKGSVLPGPSDWQDPNRRTQTLVQPHTGQAWARFPMADQTDVDAAVAQASAARVSDWTPQARAARFVLLENLIAEILKRQDDLAASICAELGCAPTFALDKHVGAALAHLRAFAQMAQTAADDTAPDPDHPQHRVRYEPMGVAALITPWNWPLNQLVLKVGAALVAGCAMILKPSELSTPTALILAECMAEAGVPPGVFTLLLGDGEVGHRLCAHPGVNVISFTGSTQVGRQIAQAAGANLTRTALELGGKSPNLLFADCALPLAVEQGVAHAFRNAGQSCNAASRMLAQAPIYDQVVQLAGEIAAKTPAAPLVSQAQFDQVQGHIKHAIADGARLITGGLGKPNGVPGFTPHPTIFADVTPAMRLAQAEVFGPVLAISKFTDEADGITQANTGPYGLAAYVQTNDPARADRVARQLDVGMVQINGSSRAPGAPFGGRKTSGWGREAGLWGIRAFQDVKSISGAEKGG